MSKILYMDTHRMCGNRTGGGTHSGAETARNGERQGELRPYLCFWNFSYKKALSKSTVVNREPERPCRQSQRRWGVGGDPLL